MAEIDASREQALEQLDAAAAAALKSAQAEGLLDGHMFSGNQSRSQMICLPMPALSARFLFGSEGFPLGRFYMIDGEQESCKTSLCYEIATWHRKLHGITAVIETEMKDSAPLRDSFFNYDSKAWMQSPGFTQQMWQQAFFTWSNFFRDLMDGRVGEDPKTGKKVKIPGVGRVMPCCLIIDSLAAVALEEQAEHMLAEGAPKMNHPIHAKLMSDFFKVAITRLARYPITLLGVNHLKTSADPRMPHIMRRNTYGGAAPKFMMTTEIEMKRRKGVQQQRVHKEYGEIYSIPLEMLIRKNSMAQKETLEVEMSWYFDRNDPDPVTGEPRQKTYFDWHSASIELLLQCIKPGDSGQGFSAKRARAVQELLELDKDDDKRTIASRPLGVSSKSPISYREAGMLLEQKLQAEPAFATELYGLLNIHRRKLFRRGVDYQIQINDYEQELAAAETAGAPMLVAGAAELDGIDPFALPDALPDVPLAAGGEVAP